MPRIYNNNNRMNEAIGFESINKYIVYAFFTHVIET